MNFSSLKKHAIVAGAVLALVPAAALAQDNTLDANVATGTTTVNTTATTTTDPAMNTMTGTDMMADNMATTDPMMTDPTVNTMVADPMMTDTNMTTDQYTQVQQEEDDNDFPWGLLGLLGLAGLLGRKKHDSADIHVDARDNRR